LKGLTGRQGVIVPHANLRNLMLRREVCESVRLGNFHLWAVKTIDEAVALLTGHEFGARQGDGAFPKGTFNAGVASRLEIFAQAMNNRPTSSRKQKNPPAHAEAG
jgi:predicted ATP-dependent protease